MHHKIWLMQMKSNPLILEDTVDLYFLIHYSYLACWNQNHINLIIKAQTYLCSLLHTTLENIERKPSAYPKIWKTKWESMTFFYRFTSKAYSAAILNINFHLYHLKVLKNSWLNNSQFSVKCDMFRSFELI